MDLGFSVDWTNASQEELSQATFSDLNNAFIQCNGILIIMRRDFILHKEGVDQLMIDNMQAQVMRIIEGIRSLISNFDVDDINGLESLKDSLILTKGVIMRRRSENLKITNAKLVSDEEAMFLGLLGMVQEKLDDAILRHKDDIGLPDEE